MDNKYNIHNKKQAKISKNNMSLDPQNDGYGILNAIPIISFLSKNPPKIIGIEEPTKFLHPSIIPNYLSLLMTLVYQKKSQIFISTHDIITALHFFLSFIKGDTNIGIFKFEEVDDKIEITSVTKENYDGILSDFISPFQIETSSELLRSLSGLNYMQSSNHQT